MFGLPVYAFILSSYAYYIRRKVLQARYVIVYIPRSIVSLLKQDVLNSFNVHSFNRVKYEVPESDEYKYMYIF